jgi:hypothetical protein
MGINNRVSNSRQPQMNEKPETVVAGSLSIKILSEPSDQINSMIQVKKQKQQKEI